MSHLEIRDLINTLIKHTLDLQSDFPSLRGIVILERIKFIYKGAPLKYLIHDASQDGAIPSKTQDRHIFLNFWDIFSRSWNILKEGLLEDNSAKVGILSCSNPIVPLKTISNSIPLDIKCSISYFHY